MYIVWAGGGMHPPIPLDLSLQILSMVVVHVVFADLKECHQISIKQHHSLWEYCMLACLGSE